MLGVLPVALAALFAGQTPDDLVLCTGASDCPPDAACEDGVCVMREAEPPPGVPRKKRVRRKRERRRRERDPNHCRRGDCEKGQECFRGSCGPPVPSAGTGLLVAGGITSGVSLLFFGGAAICQVGEGAQRDQNVCTSIEATIGAIAIAVGVPMLVLGILRRMKFTEWMKEYHPQLAVVPTASGATASLGIAF